MKDKKSIDWKQFDEKLGTMPDLHLAKLVGCAEKTILYRRKSLSIAPFGRHPWSLSDQALFALGKICCVKCQQNKDINSFNRVSKSTSSHTGRTRVCIECFNSCARLKRAIRKFDAIALMGEHCSSCGYSQYISALQFHHVNSDKDSDISRLFFLPGKRDQLMAELDKCCLLCSNCHDAFHGGELTLEFVKAELGYRINRGSRGV